jgi:DNA-directed RNA polymerase subunit RPC12/RpoP
MEAAQSKLVTCACIMCNGHVQFEPQHAGLRINCPYCGMEIVLHIPPDVTPRQPAPAPPQTARESAPGA